MSASESYFQFPLCFLAHVPMPENIGMVVDYCVVEAGEAFSRKPDFDEMVDGFSGELPCGYKERNMEHRRIVAGMAALCVKGGSIGTFLENHRQMRAFHSMQVNKYGEQPLVRVKAEFVWEVRDRRGMSWREFAVYAAILSVIGAKKYPVRVTRDAIRCRMLGFKSKAMMEAELAGRKDGPLPLTVRQIGYTLDRLDERRFYSRTRANERQTYYSVRLDREQLDNQVIANKTWAKGFHELRRGRNALLMAKLKEKQPAIKVDNAENCPSDVHSASTVASTGPSAECPL